MKSKISHLAPYACAALLLLPMGHSWATETQLKLNFSLGDPTTNTPTSARTIAGFDNVCAPFVGTSVNASISNIDGLGYGFTIDNVSSYDSGNNAEPLTTSGFYTYNNNTLDHIFTLTGLPVGATVQMYAVAAWDGNGRGGVVAFGTGVTEAQTVGDPGATPTLANFTLINSTPFVVGAGGTLTGTLNGAGGVNSATEGQVGAFIFDITLSSVPEPGEWGAAIGGGLFGLVLLRRKRGFAAAA